MIQFDEDIFQMGWNHQLDILMLLNKYVLGNVYPYFFFGKLVQFDLHIFNHQLSKVGLLLLLFLGFGNPFSYWSYMNLTGNLG